MKDLGKWFSQGLVLWWLSGGECGKRWVQVFFWRSSSLLCLRQAIELEGPRNRLGTTSHRASALAQRPSTSLAQALRQCEPLSHPCLCDLIAVAVCLGYSLWDLVFPFGRPEDTEGQLVWVSGCLRDDNWLDRMWESGPKGDANWDLPLLSQDWDLRGWKLCLGTLPFLPGQRITFIWYRLTGTSWLNHDLISRTKDLTPRSLQ